VQNNPRKLDAINLSYQLGLSKGKNPLEYFVDVHESHGRLFRGRSDGLQKDFTCLTRYQEHFAFAADRILFSDDYARFMGFGQARIKDLVDAGSQSLSDQVCKELFANSMSLPHIGTIIALIMTSVEYDPIFEAT